jgi:hypothetical protein
VPQIERTFVDQGEKASRRSIAWGHRVETYGEGAPKDRNSGKKARIPQRENMLVPIGGRDSEVDESSAVG